MKLKRICKDKLDIVVFVCITAVFAYFFLFHDVVECGDSFQYENQYPMREPVYSLMLQILQFVAGDGYMSAVGFIQNLLAVICTYWAYRRLKTVFGFRTIFSIGTFCTLMAPHLLTPLASKTHLILTNNIMTEGITISLYYIWAVMLIGRLKDYYQKKQVRCVQIVSLFVGLVLAMTRGQMILCLAIWLLVEGFIELISKEAWKKKLILICSYILAVLILVIAKGQITKWYNLAETGYYVNTISSKPMMLANLVYVCDESDADYIQDEKLRETFRQIVVKAHEDGLTMEHGQGGIISMGRFHEAGHDALNFDYIDPAVRVYIKDMYGIDEAEFINLMIYEDSVCDSIIKQLLPKVMGKYLHNYIIIAALGFVRSVAVEKSIIPFFAILVYLMAVLMIIAGLLCKDCRNEAYVMTMILITICGTVLGTSLMIQCITRYMIYNLPFFYIAAMGLAKKLFDCRKKNVN